MAGLAPGSQTLKEADLSPVCRALLGARFLPCGARRTHVSAAVLTDEVRAYTDSTSNDHHENEQKRDLRPASVNAAFAGQSGPPSECTVVQRAK